MTTVAVHGGYNNTNFGDLLLLDLMSRFVRSELGSTPICPWQASDTPALLGLSRPRGLWDCWSADAAILGGGGYLHDHGGGALTRRLLRYSIPAQMWRLRDRPYVIAGPGAGPSFTDKGKRRISMVCHYAKAICVRDQPSADLLIDAGVPRERIEVTADLVLALTREQIPEEAVKYAHGSLTKRQGVRSLGLHFPHGDVTSIARQVGQVLRKRSDVEVVWIYDHGMGNLDEVKKASREHIAQWRVQEFSPNPWYTAASIGQLDAVITGKLHVGITAWALNIPTCGYSYHPKSGRFYKQVGRQDFHAEFGSNPDVIGSWVSSFLTDTEKFSAESAAARIELPRKARRNYEVVKDMLGSPLEEARRASG